MKLFVLFLLIASTLQQVPRLTLFGDIDANELFTPANDMTNPFSPWGTPKESYNQKPQSYRTYYAFWNSKAFPILPAVDLFTNSLLNVNTMSFQAATKVTVNPTWYWFKFESPWLEVDPWGCTAADGNCRCNVVSSYQSPFVTSVGPLTGALSDGLAYPNDVLVVHPTQGNTMFTIEIPNYNYYEHSPYPGQHPFMRTYRKLCFQGQFGATANVQPTAWLDSTVWIAVTHACDTSLAGNFACQPTIQRPLSYSWNKVTLPDPAISADWVCNNEGFLGEFFDPTFNPVTFATVQSRDPNQCWGETSEMTADRRLRTVCCGATTASTTGIYGRITSAVGTRVDDERFKTKYGVCINPRTESCCGWKPYNANNEKCCSKIYARVNYIDQFCKCTRDGTIPAPTSNLWDCNYAGANQAATTRGETDSINSAPYCCVSSKYPELATMTQYSLCMENPSSRTMACCDDGHIFDLGVSQCCPINGVQSLNTPCPCNRDVDCPVDTASNSRKWCCLQQWPRSWVDGQQPDALATGKNQCDKYANWPDGTAPAEVQRCYGNCYDTRFQTCCNGQLCVREYERCCNSTCCNRFTSGCMEGTRSGFNGAAGGRVNPNDFQVDFETCSEIETFTTRRAFWVWVMPTFWLVATAASLAVVTVVARRATESQFDMNEKMMVFFSVVLIGLNCAHFFSPTFKYGVVAVFIGLITIVGAVMRSKPMSILVAFLMFGLILYWIDPYNGNIYFSLTGGVSHAIAITDAAFAPVGFASGIIEALFRIERNRAECTGFYDYFNFDTNAHDFARWFNPNKTTFGFCTRAWMSTLLIFSLLSMAIILVLQMLAINSVAKKVMPQTSEDDLTFQVQPVNEYAQ